MGVLYKFTEPLLKNEDVAKYLVLNDMCNYYTQINEIASKIERSCRKLQPLIDGGFEYAYLLPDILRSQADVVIDPKQKALAEVVLFSLHQFKKKAPTALLMDNFNNRSTCYGVNELALSLVNTTMEFTSERRELTIDVEYHVFIRADICFKNIRITDNLMVMMTDNYTYPDGHDKWFSDINKGVNYVLNFYKLWQLQDALD